MPLSEHLSWKKRGTDKTSKSPLTAWFQKRKKPREEAKTEAQKEEIHVEQIIQKLESIDLEASPLPPEVLEEKQYPEQPCGNIEYRILEAIVRLQKNTQDYIGLDISKINNGIYQIAVLAKQAIDGGRVHATRAACHALSVTIGEIRDKLSFVPVPLQKDFMDCAEQYIDIWLDYIENCTVLDYLQNDAKVREETINRVHCELEKETDALAERLTNDPALVKKITAIQNQSYIQHGHTWDAEMIELYRQLLNIRFKKSSLEFEVLCHNQDLQNMFVHQRILSTFLTKLRTIPQPQDPHLINKFQALIDEMKNEAAAQDQQFEKIFYEIDKMDTFIEQFANADGNLRLMDAISKQLDKMVEKARKKQMEDFGIAEEQENGSGVCLYTVEELEKMKREREAKQAQQALQNPNDPPPQT